MSKVSYYEIAEKALTGALRKRLSEIALLRMRPKADGTGWLIRSPEAITRAEGRNLQAAEEEEWDASLSVRPSLSARPVPPSLIAQPWKLIPGERKAQITRVSIAPKRSVLRVKLGDGRGDSVSLEVDAAVPAKAVNLRLEMRVPAGVTLNVEPSLRIGRGKLTPLPAKRITQGGNALLEWKLPKMAAAERARFNGVALNLSTDADALGVVLVDVAFSA